MISTAPGSYAALVLAEVVRYPGELSDRRLCYGRICVAEVPQVGISAPSRWVERLREMELLAPARVRIMPHVTIDQVARLDGQEMELMARLLGAGQAGLSVAELAQGEPSGAMERTLRDLYRAGYASPPAALWPTEQGRALVGAPL